MNTAMLMNNDPRQGWVKLEDVPEPKYPPFVIDSILHDNVTVMYGRPEAGKSFGALSLSSSMITGDAWLGLYKVRETHEVAFWALDPGEVSQIKRRQQAFPGLNNSLYVCSRRPPETDDGWHSEAEGLLRSGVDFLVIDNLIRLLPAGVSVRDDAQTEKVLRRIGIVSEYGIGVLLIHHSGKPGEDGNPKTTPLGCTAIESFALHFLRVDAEKNKATGEITRKIVSYGNDLDRDCETVGFEIAGGDGEIGEFRHMRDGDRDAARLQVMIDGGPWPNLTAIGEVLGIGHQQVSKILARTKHTRNRRTGMIVPTG